METADLEDVKTVFAALFDTCVENLRSDVIIDHNTWFSEHQDEFMDAGMEAGSTGDSESEVLFRWILESDEDTSIVQFVKTLRDLTSDSESVNSVVNYGKQKESHWIPYLVSLLDGKLIKELSLSEVYRVLDIMVDQKMITKQVHRKAREAENPCACCQIMCEGILKTRGKSNWPFVFLEAISTIKPELVQPKTNRREQHDQSVFNQAISQNKTLSFLDNVADMKNFCEDLQHRLEKQSVFSDGFINESVEPMICLSEEESKSRGVQIWVESGNINHSSVVFYDEWNTLHVFEDTDKEIGSKPKETPKIELREYQKELAEEALKGINTIICAPTGCGKTMVAVHIILTHLQEQPGGMLPRKVVFFARTVPLVMQQYQVLQMYLPSQFKATSLTGEDRNSLQLNNIIPDVDVIVMTPRILENHLIRNGQDQLDIFSLLVFDECHHTRKDEPYNMLMHYYLKRKQNIHNARSKGQQINAKLPQIIGLTASIGVGNATDVDQAKENVLELCSNLDVECISCVEKQIEELKEKVHLSKEELVTITERVKDAAVARILDKMKRLEERMVALADQYEQGYILSQKALRSKDMTNHKEDGELKAVLKKIPTYRKGLLYGNWVAKVKNIARCLPRSRLGKMNNCKRLMIILGDYLSTYNIALELHDLVLLRHVMEYLQRCFDQYQENKDCTPEEKSYFESFSDLQEMIKDHLDSENPNLTLMKSCLMKYIVAKGDASRGIIFVRTRALVRAVTSWLNNCGDPRIESLKALPFTGTSASLALGGMTAAQQKEVIQLFRMGQVRLLVATSVAEEGIDIPECNMVIKYNYTGNEITTVQTRGRSRKKGGVSIILAMSNMIEKEKMNQRKAEMMDRAVLQIRQINPLEIHKKIEAYQQQTLKNIEVNDTMTKQKNMLKRREHFKMVCHGCSDVVIDSSDIRTICQTHHIVVNWDIMKQTLCVPENRSILFDDIRLIGPVKCRGRIEGGRDCNNKLGSLMIFSNIPFVVLGITRFGFESQNHGPQSNYKNWKAVPYVIDEIDMEKDIDRYLPKEPAPQGNRPDNTRKTFLGEGHHLAHTNKTIFIGAQHVEGQGRRDKPSIQVVGLAEIGRDGLPNPPRSTGGAVGLRNEFDIMCSGWSSLSKISSTKTELVSQEKMPSLQRSEESDDDSLSTLHSDSYLESVTDEREDNLEKPGVSSPSVEENREIEDMDTMTVSPDTEHMGDNNSCSPVDAGSEIEHLAEVGDTFFG